MPEEICSGPECDRPVRRNGLCDAHSRQQWLGKPLKPIFAKPRKPAGLTCSGPECARPTVGQGLCNAHYQQKQKGKELTVLGLPPGADPIERFWSRVNKSGPIHPVLGTPCWLWTGALMPNGYGQLGIGPVSDHRHVYAHRYAWEITHGPIPEEIQVLHRCDVRHCCRAIDHLFLGTPGDNMDDKVAKGRQLKGEDNPGAKLTAEQVLEIRVKRTQGVSQAELAAEYGVSQASISLIHQRKNWGWL